MDRTAEQVGLQPHFYRSAVKRTKLRGLVRNACVALGNSRLKHGTPAHSRVTMLLEKLSSFPDELIADPRWALEKLGKG